MFMTQQEIENNFTYKIVRKVLMREYPWIKDVRLDIEGLEKYTNVIFIEIFIDPYQMTNMYGWNVPRWIETSIREGEPYESTVLSLFVKQSSEEVKWLRDEIEQTIYHTQNSPAIPQDMRLDKQIVVGYYRLTDNLTIPNDIE
jgi:hypothetical protein